MFSFTHQFSMTPIRSFQRCFSRYRNFVPTSSMTCISQRVQITLPGNGSNSKHNWKKLFSTQSAMMVSLRADPQVCMQDVHTSLSVRGLPPHSPVTLRAEVSNDSGKKFCSHGQYVSSSSGEVLVDSAASVGGSYTGVFPAGLLTTLAPPPGEFPFRRLYKIDPAVPWQISITAHSGHLPVSLDAPGDCLASITLTRLLMAPGVTRRRVREGRVRGVLYMPAPHHGPAVGLIDMFGAVGGIMEFRAAMLASRGYAVLALPFFAYDDLPPVPDTLHLEYFEEAANFIMAQENVIPDRCGMVSVSKSTDIALLLSTKLPALTAVVCIGVVSVSYDTNIMYKGQLVAEGIKLSVDHMDIDELGRVHPKKEMLEALSVVNEKDGTGMLRLEEASPECHYLLVAGSEDTWMCYMCIPHLQKYMARHGRSDKIEGIIYSGAGHLIEPPYGPLIHHSYQRVLPVVASSIPSSMKASSSGFEKVEELPGGKTDKTYVTGVPILFGGKAKETCDAQVDLWQRMQAFLNRRVRDTSPWYQQYLINTKIKSGL